MTRLTSRFLLLSLLLSLIVPASLVRHAPASRAASRLDSTTDAAERTLNWAMTGPMGGDVRSLEIDPIDPQHLLLGTIDGQIYRSTDGAKNWSRVVNFNRPGLYIDHIIIDPRDSRTAYVAAHKHKEPGGFFKTTDGGETWREAADLKGEALHSLTQSPTNPDLLVVGSNRGVYRSADAGETWTKYETSAYPDIRNVESLAIDPRNDDHLYVGTWHLPWKTEDGGKTWKSIKTGMIDDSDVFAIEVDQKTPDHVIASACSGIYESKNAGATWRKVQGIPSQSRRTRDIMQHPSHPEIIFAGTTEGFWRSADGGDSWKLVTSRQLEINAIAVHPREPQTVYIGTNNYGVMISRDGGKNFVPSNEGFSGRRAYAVVPDREQPGRFYAATINTATGGGFFFVSNDGGETWRPSMRNMPNRLIAYSILQDRGDANVIYLGTNLGLYRSTDRGASWAPVSAPCPEDRPAKKRAAPSLRGARGSNAAGRLRQSARAATRPKRARGSGAAGGGAATAPNIGAETAAASNVGAEIAAAQPKPCIAPSAANPAANKKELTKRAQAALNAAGYDVGTPDGVAGTRTVAQLRKFQAAKGIPQTGSFDATTLAALGLGGGKQSNVADAAVQDVPVVLTEAINALAYLTREDGPPHLLAATNTGLYRTADPDRGWEKLPFGAGLDRRALCVSAHAQEPQTIWVGTSTSGVLVSRDGGKTWQRAEGVSSAAPINVIEQDPQRPDYVYVGTTHTLFLTRDGGQSWQRRGGNLPYGSFTAILINPQNTDEIFAGSAYEREENNGVFHSTDAGGTWKRVDPELPSRRVWTLALDTREAGKLLVGSHSGGVYVAQREVGASAATAGQK